jgi:hypothetical protein
MCIDKEKKTPTTNIFELIIVFSGYISPEYALEGLFSIRSDVFSFGVLFLEIVSGKKSTGLYLTDSLHLLGYVSISLVKIKITF